MRFLWIRKYQKRVSKRKRSVSIFTLAKTCMPCMIRGWLFQPNQRPFVDNWARHSNATKTFLVIWWYQTNNGTEQRLGLTCGRSWHLTFAWGRYGWFQKKNFLQTDFEGKKFLQGNTWRKKFVRKKIYLSWHIVLGKKSYAVVCQENSITGGLGEKNVSSKPNQPYSSSPSKARWLSTNFFRPLLQL